MQLEIPQDTVLGLLDASSKATPPVPTLLNPAPAAKLPREYYSKISHLILNESEAAELTDRKSIRTNSDEELLQDCKDVATAFVEKGITTSVVITLGERGAFWHDVEQDTSGIVPSQKVKVVDTTAAGDTFVGAFAVKIVNGHSIEAAVAFAIQASSKTVTQRGAQSSIPWRDELLT